MAYNVFGRTLNLIHLQLSVPYLLVTQERKAYYLIEMSHVTVKVTGDAKLRHQIKAGMTRIKSHITFFIWKNIFLRIIAILSSKK